jgi:hypothetical protein
VAAEEVIAAIFGSAEEDPELAPIISALAEAHKAGHWEPDTIRAAFVEDAPTTP